MKNLIFILPFPFNKINADDTEEGFRGQEAEGRLGICQTSWETGWEEVKKRESCIYQKHG